VHVPDGFIDAPVSLVAGAAAVGGLAVCLRGARREMDERTAPLAGLVAAFVFAVQMLNFPVAVGTSGHLIGGALAAVLVGPWTGAVCVSVVLMVQAVLFADGGLTALGVNIILLAFLSVASGYGIFRLLVAVLPKRSSSVVAATAVAAGCSVPLAALGFVGVYAVGGTTAVPMDAVAAAMVGVHLLIGVGEGVITALTVASVLAVRPDLVRGARHLLRADELTVRPATASLDPGAR
jgi:cobalamin biosynthesis protein CbiM